MRKKKPLTDDWWRWVIGKWDKYHGAAGQTIGSASPKVLESCWLYGEINTPFT